MLGSTGFRATLLISHYVDDPRKNPEFVSIAVEKKVEDGDLVCLQREFRAVEVPGYILTAKTKDVMTYDEKNRTVRFRIGPRIFQYKLPES